MATADQVRALVQAHADGDDPRFRATVLSIAAHADAKSPAFAKTLRALANRNPHPTVLTALPTGMNQLLAVRPTAKLDDMVLDAATRDRLDRVLIEQRARETLFVHGLEPMRKLLFVGAPGVGKTLAAAAIAGELGLPLLSVQLHATISSHLGETAAQIGKIFDSVRRVRAVYLFDEFDALAAERGADKSDVGEMRRVVNSLLTFIENDDSTSLIIAATNHPAMIDRAMFRRFDEIVTFPIPTDVIAERLILQHLTRRGIQPHPATDWAAVRTAAAGVSHADLVRACDRVSKDAVLAGRAGVYTIDLVTVIGERSGTFDTRSTDG